MQFTNFEKVVEVLDGLSTHYQDNSLEWAQKKEQYAAEWDELIAKPEDDEEYPKEVCNCVDDCIC